MASQLVQLFLANTQTDAQEHYLKRCIENSPHLALVTVVALWTQNNCSTPFISNSSILGDTVQSGLTSKMKLTKQQLLLHRQMKKKRYA